MDKNDRCDRCSAQALHRFSRESAPDMDLMFCGHHTQKFLADLHADGWVFIDSVLVEA